MHSRSAERQVQRRVRRVKVARAGCTVSDPGDSDCSEHGGQIALVTLFRPGAPHTVGADHDLGAPLLATGPQVQVVLEQAARQLPTALGELILKLGMGQLTATRIG